MKVSKNKLCLSFCAMVLNFSVTTNAHAAIALDRTRVIFNGADHSESLNITNQNKTLPYLAQAWVEDAQGQKLTHPLLALPPLQRVEPGAKSQIKIQATPDINSLPQDKESLFYFNVREIPPKSSKPNTLQIALQTRIKMFYRPAALAISADDNNVFQKQVTLIKEGDRYTINNPTSYFITIIGAAPTEKGHDIAEFKPIMIEPKGREELKGSASALGAHPHLMFINDYGGRPQLVFNCAGNTCSVTNIIQG